MALMNKSLGRAPTASRPRVAERRAVVVRATAAADNLGFKTMRDGIKVAADESILTPRFYTT